MDHVQVNGHHAHPEAISLRLVWAEITALLSQFWLDVAPHEYDELYSQASFDEIKELLSATEMSTTDKIRILKQIDLLAISLLPYPEFTKEAERLLTLSCGAQGAPCIESIYKPWTTDTTCTLPIARKTGYIMGDSALHMQSLLAHLELEQPTHLMPDHLSVELGVFSVLLEHSTIHSCTQFIHDHLDWLSDYRTALINKSASEHFIVLADLTHCIIDHIERWLEGEDHE